MKYLLQGVENLLFWISFSKESIEIEFPSQDIVKTYTESDLIKRFIADGLSPHDAARLAQATKKQAEDTWQLLPER